MNPQADQGKVKIHCAAIDAILDHIVKIVGMNTESKLGVRYGKEASDDEG